MTRFEAWKQGMTDRQAADLLGIAPSSYGGWRLRRGLPRNKWQRRPNHPAEEREAVVNMVMVLCRLADRAERIFKRDLTREEIERIVRLAI